MESSHQNLSINASSSFLRPYTDPIHFLITTKVQKFTTGNIKKLNERLNSKSKKQLRLEGTEDYKLRMETNEDKDVRTHCTFQPNFSDTLHKLRPNKSVGDLTMASKMNKSRLSRSAEKFYHDQKNFDLKRKNKIKAKKEEDNVNKALEEKSIKELLCVQSKMNNIFYNKSKSNPKVNYLSRSPMNNVAAKSKFKPVGKVPVAQIDINFKYQPNID